MISQLIKIIKTGDKAAVKEAQKQVAKVANDRTLDRNALKKELWAFIGEMKTFDQIKDIDHQTYFINTVKWAFIYLGSDYFKECEEFVIRQIQNPSGKIRQALLNAVDWLDMTLHITRSSWMKNISDEEIERDRKRFCEFAYKVSQLLDWNYRKEYSRYKYIASLPPSVYKSLQVLLNDHLLRGELHENIFEEFIREEKGMLSVKGRGSKKSHAAGREAYKSYFHETNVLPQQKLLREAISRLLKERSVLMKFEEIEHMIYEEDDAHHNFNALLDKTGFFDEEGFRLLNDAWNYFPHESLNGLCPMEMLLKEHLEEK